MSDQPENAEATESMDDDTPNRVTDPIATQEEADGLRAGMEMRKSIPPAEMTPVMEDEIALDEARLAQWDAEDHSAPAEADDGEEEADA